MYRHTRRILPRAIAAMVIATAIGAPSASARFQLDPTTSSPSDAAALVAASAPATGGAHASQAGSTDFSWGDAGIGAAGAVLIVGLGTGGIAVRRTRGHGHPATS